MCSLRLCPVPGPSFHAALSGSFLSVLACTDPIVSVLLSTLRGFRLVLRNAIVCEDKRRVVWPHEIVVRGPCMHLRMRRYVQWPMYGDTCSVWTMVALTHVSHVAVVFLLLLSVAAYRRMHRCIGGLVSPTRRPKLTGLCPVAGASFHAACREVS